MISKEILRKIKDSVFELLNNESTGHDFYHIDRVVNNTIYIAKKEDCDLNYAVLLAYLHDVGDYKIHGGIDKTSEILPQLLQPLNLNSELISKIISDIDLIGYKGGFNKSATSVEVKIVQDADRLDAIGAIGIARAFAYGGSNGHVLYDPEYKSEKYANAEAYQKSKAPTIQHFYDKLLKLKDLMNTQTGKQLAEERHIFMQYYLAQFYAESEIRSTL